MKDYELIGHRLRQLRKELGLAASDVAKVLTCSRGTIYHYEKARLRISLVDLQKVAKHYGVPLAYFLGEEVTISEDQRRAARESRFANEVERIIARRDDLLHTIQVPLVGTVPGGRPDFREQERPQDFLSLKYSGPKPREVFALRVTGNSMIGKGIVNGTIVFVDATKTPKDGDIVIAHSDDKTVIRIFRQEGDQAYLEAANDGYNRLRLVNAEIDGVVIKSENYYQ